MNDNNAWVKPIIGALFGALSGALITGFVSMALFNARMATFGQRVSTLEQSQDRAALATEKLIDATQELAMEVRLLRQRLDRLDPEGRR